MYAQREREREKEAESKIMNFEKWKCLQKIINKL